MEEDASSPRPRCGSSVRLRVLCGEKDSRELNQRGNRGNGGRHQSDRPPAAVPLCASASSVVRKAGVQQLEPQRKWRKWRNCFKIVGTRSHPSGWKETVLTYDQTIANARTGPPEAPRSERLGRVVTPSHAAWTRAARIVARLVRAGKLRAGSVAPGFFRAACSPRQRGIMASRSSPTISGTSR